MSSLGRPSTTIDLNTGTITAVSTIQSSVQVVQQEAVDNKEYFENLIGQQGVTRDDEGDVTEQHSVKDNLETLYNMLTGVAAATGQEEIAGPLIAFKEIYDNFDYAYQEGDSIHDAIKKFKEYVGHPQKLPVLEERDEDGNIITEFEDGVDARGLFKIYNMLYLRDDETDETDKNLYLDNKHAGEIRFQTANALNNNDGGLYYNTKINDKGHLCYYHNTDAISVAAWTPIMLGAGENPLPISGWYDLDSSFKACAINIALNSVGINILFAKMKALKIADTVEKTGDGVWTAVEGGYNTIKSSLAIIGGIGGGAIAGHLSALNILNQQKKANEYLEDELRKIKEEIDNINNGTDRQDENDPYNEMSLIDLEYIQQQIELQLLDGYALQQEYDIAYQKQNNFLHQDYLNNSKFQLVDSPDGNNKTLISPNLDFLEQNVGSQQDNKEIDTIYGKIAKNVYDIDNIENTIGTPQDNKDTATIYGNIAKNVYDIDNLENNVFYKDFITGYSDSKFQLTPIYDNNNNIINYKLESLLLEHVRVALGTRNSSDFETAFQKIAANKTDIETNKDDIETNKDDIETNKDDIVDLRTDLTTQTERIDDMRLVLGYDDNSILHLILPLNDLGETPSIEANLINNKGLLDLGYKKNDLVNNYDDYFNLFFAIPKLHSEQTITTFTENEIVNGLSPTNANITFITDYDNLKSYMTGTLNFEVSNNNLCISLFAKLSQLTEFKNLLFYNGITAFVKNDKLKINYNKEISNTYTILDNTFANGTPPLTYTDLNYYDNRYTYHISRTDDKLINYIEILDNVNMDYGDGIDIFTTTSIRGYKLTNIVDSVEIYFKHDVVIKNINLVLKRFWTYGSGFTQTPFEVFAKLNISIRNSINDPWVQILQNDYKALGYSQYQGVTSFNISDENQSLSCRFLSISFEYNAPPLQPSHGELELCFLNILDTHTLTEYTNGEAVLLIQNNNEYSHIVYNHSQNNKTFNFLIDGITRDFNLTDYFEVNTNQLVIGDNDLQYRMLGIGNTYHTNSQIVQEIRDLNDTSLRVNIDGLTKVDDLYVKDNLLVNKLEFINGNEVVSFAPSVEETGGRRRALISDTTYTLLDEVIIPNAPTENSFLYYDVSTANVSTRSDVVLDEDLTSYQLKTEAFDGDYGNLNNTPDLFSGDYTDLSNKPTLFSGNYTDLNNKPTLFDGNYNNLNNKPTLFDGNYNNLNNKPDLFDGNYNNLNNKPTPFDNDYNSLDNLPTLFSGNYDDLNNLPILFDGNYNSLDNLPILFDGNYNSLDNLPTLFDGNYDSLNNLPILFDGNYNSLDNLPTLFDGDYNSLNNLPNLTIYSTFSGSYNDLIDKPTLFSGSYIDLTNKPTLFSGSYIDLTNKPTLFDGDYNNLNNLPNLTIYSTFSGSYNDLIDKPTLFSGSYTDLTNKPTLFSGSYDDLTNKPDLNSISYTETKVLNYLTNNDYTTNSIVDSKLLNYELKNNVGTYNIVINSIEFSGFYITANTREWNYNNEYANNLNYIGGDTLIINYNNIISSTSGDFYVEIYTDDENNPEVVINNGVASNNLPSITVTATSGKTYRILTRRRTDDMIWYATNLNVKLTIEYVNNRFNDYALITDIPTEFNLSTKTTDDLTEGTTNKYYTDSRVGSYLTANQYAKTGDIPTAYTDTDVIGVLNENGYIRYIHLSAGLDLKANLIHTHEISDINNLSVELANINQYSDQKVQEYLDANNYTSSTGSGFVTDGELSTAISEINQYSDVKVNTFLTTKNYLTSIPAEYVKDTELSTAIGGKADTGHTHTTADITDLKYNSFHMDVTTSILGENRFGICYFGNSGNGWSIIPKNNNGGFLYNNGGAGASAYSWQNITHYTDTDVRDILSQSAGDNLVWNATTSKFDATGGTNQFKIEGTTNADMYCLTNNLYGTSTLHLMTNYSDNYQTGNGLVISYLNSDGYSRSYTLLDGEDIFTELNKTDNLIRFYKDFYVNTEIRCDNYLSLDGTTEDERTESKIISLLGNNLSYDTNTGLINATGSGGGIPTLENTYPLFDNTHFDNSTGLIRINSEVLAAGTSGEAGLPYEIINTPTVDNPVVNGLTSIAHATDETRAYYIFETDESTTSPHTVYNIEFFGNTTIDVLIVGGGGGGGWSIGGGGGGGGVIHCQNMEVGAGIYQVVVGKGGIETGTSEQSKGQESIVFGLTARGGGGGARSSSWGTYDDRYGSSGGSSGGAGAAGAYNTHPGITALAPGTNISTTSIITAGTITNYDGFKGGNSRPRWGNGPVGSAGGGGANEAGNDGCGDGTNNLDVDDGAGGDGIPINITGTSYYWGAGGGGGVYALNSYGRGGKGGGGSGGSTTGFTFAGDTYGINDAYPAGGDRRGGDGGRNTGGGGGGSGFGYNGGSKGGSGVVIISYVLQPEAISYKLNINTLQNQQTEGFLKYDNTNGWNINTDVIPTSLSQLSGTIPYSSITSTPSIPTSLSQLSGTLPYSSITGTPTIPTNFDSRYYRKNQLYQYLEPTGLSLQWWNGTDYSYETTFEINTNYILQDVNRPVGSYNFRWLLRISGGTLGLTHWYINTFIFYDSKENIFFNDIKNGWPTANFAFSNRWGDQGDHYIKVTITTTGTEMTRLNVNIS